MSAGTTAVPLRARPAPTGEAEGRRLARRSLRRIGAAQMAAGLWGAIDVFLLLWLVLPSPDSPASDGTIIARNAIALAVLLPLTAIAGTLAARRLNVPVLRWLAEGRAPTEAERRDTLCLPLRAALLDAAGWTASAIAFYAINRSFGADVAVHVASVIVLGGLTCTALGYLLAERIARPLTARSLSYGPVTRPKGPGVAGRLVLVWLFASGVPLVGMILLGCHVLVEGGVSAERLATSVIVLCGVGNFVGLRRGGAEDAERAVAFEPVDPAAARGDDVDDDGEEAVEQRDDLFGRAPRGECG